MIPALLVLLALAGLPLFAVLALAAFAGYHGAGLDASLVAMEFQRLGQMPVLMALPLFTFTGLVLACSGTPGHLAALAGVLGRRSGGALGILVALGAAGLAAFSGAAAAAAPGAGMPPALAGSGRRESGVSLVAAGASAGLWLAPSVPLVLYAYLARQLAPGRDVAAQTMFLAGLLPALAVLCAVIFLSGFRRGSGEGRPEAAPGRAGAGLRALAWDAPLPVLVLGGLYAGGLTVAEAAALSAAWVMATAVFIRRELAVSRLPGLITEAMVLAGAVLVLVGMSMALSSIIVDQDWPGQVQAWLAPRLAGPEAFLSLAAAALFVLAALAGFFPGLVIGAVLLIPFGHAFGINPVQFGIVALGALQLARLASGDKPAAQVRPVLVIWLVALAAVVFQPSLSLWLPGRL